MLKKLWTMGLASLLMGSALPVFAQTNPGAQTHSPDPETIIGERKVVLPAQGVLPFYYTLPMVINVVQDTSITSSTPITDNATDFKAWAELISECARSVPVMERQTPDGPQSFTMGGQEGKVKLNASDQPVCLLN
jgi:hypothetical protein